MAQVLQPIRKLRFPTQGPKRMSTPSKMRAWLAMIDRKICDIWKRPLVSQSALSMAQVSSDATGLEQSLILIQCCPKSAARGRCDEALRTALPSAREEWRGG
ncbi:hypothetical protein J1614_010866 [Plenodomus biglobosus]|nr:hypothetical protein J1614_010866 [Plenodomus biglobosus]